jgi:MFS transporter, putative metabolite:H+ symporter
VMEEATPLYVAGRLDRLPLSAFHWRMLFMIGAGLFLDTFDVYLGGSIAGTLLKEGWSTLDLNAMFGSATFFGLMVGAWMAGVLGDRYGRRFSFQINLVIFGVASIVAAFAPNMPTLIGLRFVMGIGLGAEIVVAYAMLSEFVPPRHRGRMLAILGLFANSSAFIATIVSLWVIPNFGWRPLFGAIGIVAVAIWAMRKTMPESPRWLEEQGRIAEAEKTLRAIEEDVARGGQLPDYPRDAQPPVTPVSFGVLFSKDVLPRTLVGCLTMMVIGFSIYGFLGWLPSFFVKQGHDIIQSLAWSAVIALGAPAGNVVGILIADRIGRKRSILVATLSACVFGLVYQHSGSDTMLLVMGFLLVGSIYLLVAVGQGVYVPELFPTQYRLRGAGLCGTMGRLTSATCQFFILWLFGLGGVSYVVGAVVAAMLLLAVVVMLFGVETSGKRLEEISESLEVVRRPGRAVSEPLSVHGKSGT